MEVRGRGVFQGAANLALGVRPRVKIGGSYSGVGEITFLTYYNKAGNA